MQQSLDIGGVRIETIRRGHGRALLFLHPAQGLEPGWPVLERLAARAELIAPSHPGFGRSELPRGMSSVDDISYLYLDFLEALDIREAIVVGISFGAWIAAEIAVKSCERISHLVLADPVGVKLGKPYEQEIVDIFSVTQPELDELCYADPALARRDYSGFSDMDLNIVARNRESAGWFAWAPYMHDPKLKHRLHRIKAPTLFLRGRQDRVVKEDYVRGFCSLVPGASFETIEGAGHFPHIEQPEIFADRILRFAGV